jgi:hypothetical protein
MRGLTFLALAAVAAIGITASAPRAQAQVAVEIGVAPECPYGYYDSAPYGCAPYGYYGPEWFTGGVFVGAGPWYHGPEHFQGHVDTHYDVQHGYKGPVPKVGEKPEPSKHPEQVASFKGDEVHDGHGKGPAGGEKH